MNRSKNSRLKSILMMITCFTLTCLLNATSLANSTSTLIKLTITDAQPSVTAAYYRANGFDVLEGSVTESSFELIVSEEEYQKLKAKNLTIVRLERGQPLAKIRAVNTRGLGVPNGYRNLTDINQYMLNIAVNFPAIAQRVNLTQTYGQPQTSEGRDMFALKISDNVTADEDEPGIMIVSNHHAREIVTPVIALDAMDRLTQGYGNNTQITNAINNSEIWIAANWNPDGYEEVFTGDNFWRKNRRVLPGGIGVDQNRNYPQGWNSNCSGSTSPSSQVYKGPAPASEPETQTMIAWSQDQRFAKVIDYHSFGEEVLYGYSCTSHPFTAYYESEAIDLAFASGYMNSVRPAGAEGEHYQWQFAQSGSWSHLIETHTQFQPSYTAAQAESDRLWPGILHAIERPIPLTGRVTDASTQAAISASIVLPGVNFSAGESNQSAGPFGRFYVFAPPGTYAVEFSAAGYVTQTVNLTLQNGQSLAQNIQLVSATQDTDNDGHPDISDNCTTMANSTQIDTDSDGYGNACDADYDNNCIVNFGDVSMLANAFLTTNANLDLSGDGLINFADFALIPGLFQLPPGPSGTGTLCP